MIENLLVRVGKFVFSDDFIIMDFNGKQVVFNVLNALQYPEEELTECSISQVGKIPLTKIFSKVVTS